MHADAISLLDIFQSKQRLEVPLFQRQYVWNKDQQWEPLWEDITRKFAEHLEGRVDGPAHFLGAMVLDQKFSPTTHVARRQVIDGQQRLTTLQLFLAAFRDFCDEHGCSELAQEARSFTLNTGMMPDPAVDKFKVWPTALDRPQFVDVMDSGSRAALELKHPLVRRKYAKRPDPRPRMVEAYLYFYDQLSGFFLGFDGEEPVANGFPLANRLEECLSALRSSLRVVVIDLDKSDDPQVIFETLNARGEPLLPADLLRNFIFLRAGRIGENQEQLYDKYWRGFDDRFWREEVRQGRLNRPRSDQFVQHFLASRLTRDISAKHLYVEYKHWIETEHPFSSISDELATLARQREDFRRLVKPKQSDVLFGFSTFLEIFDVSTIFPMLLFLLGSGESDSDICLVSTQIESYLLRRAVCGLTTKNYNRIFLALTKQLNSTSEPCAAVVSNYLSSLGGDSSVWPSDNEFRTAWTARNVFQAMTGARIAYILRRLNDTFLTTKSEQISFSGPLTIEHILPRSWVVNWPLSDGSKGVPDQELWSGQVPGEQIEATNRRNALVHTVGNLTLLTQPLNSANSNSPWSIKKALIQANSLLPINLPLTHEESWDEEAIARRSHDLFSRALVIWPRPPSN